MKKIIYRDGDILKHTPEIKRTLFIPHICNNEGGWGAGFVIALSKKWNKPESYYRNLPSYELGTVSFPPVEKNIFVVNMIAQDGYKNENNPIPIKYDSLVDCLRIVKKQALSLEAEIAAPMFGAGLAGGDWKVIESLIQTYWLNYNIPVFIYKF